MHRRMLPVQALALTAALTSCGERATAPPEPTANNTAPSAAAPAPRVNFDVVEASIPKLHAALLVGDELSAPLPDAGVPVVQVTALAERRGALAARFYADPSASLSCIGVTGTNGKTSVAYHIADLSTRLGTPAGYCGTLGWGVLDALTDGGMTTPNAVALQRQLASMRDQGMRAAVLEVSSHALDQDRARQVHFDIAVFTNLSRDHLDYHGTLEAYAAAKARLFTQWPLRAAVINVDDEFGMQLTTRCAAEVISYGRAGDWRWHSRPVDGGLQVRWQTPLGEIEQHVGAVAEFAVANIAAAMAVLTCMGHDLSAVAAELPRLRGVPGRMEVFSGDGRAPLVVVDYAHTPDALAKVLASLRAYGQGRLLCVVGCGGDRDRGKRPQMGQHAAAGADRVWFTADNPRSEAVSDIIDDMLQGLSAAQRARVTVMPDRAEAIRAAIAEGKASDVVLVAGKGHEDYQEVGGRRLPFDDRRVVNQALEEVF